tara:strand:- start:223 stop:354 length:132 start_codon:yes stop_codon:yes gene_type:complete
MVKDIRVVYNQVVAHLILMVEVEVQVHLVMTGLLQMVVREEQE